MLRSARHKRGGGASRNALNTTEAELRLIAKRGDQSGGQASQPVNGLQQPGRQRHAEAAL